MCIFVSIQLDRVSVVAIAAQKKDKTLVSRCRSKKDAEFMHIFHT